LDIVRNHFVRRNLPLPGLHGRSLENVTADDLERLAMKAEKYRINWSSSSPRPTRRVELPTMPNSYITFLNFCSRGGEHWLFSLSSVRIGGSHAYVLQCWDLKANPPLRIGWRIFRSFFGLASNKLSSGEAAVAVMTPEYVRSIMSDH